MTRWSTFLRAVYLLPNIIGYLSIFSFVPATWSGAHESWVASIAGGYFLSVFFLLCFEGASFTYLPKKIGAMLWLIIPSVFLVAFPLFHGTNLAASFREMVLLYTTSVIAGWSIVTLVAGFKQRGSFLFLLVFAAIFLFPAACALALFWGGMFAVYSAGELVIIGVLMTARIVAMVRYVGIGVLR